ncbi:MULTISPECIES: hypothetical protein [unclassified Crossiella]|uniref:hypothetical protein n=1 Tax=unclassified Crossiella TaxID=2620835 RepID=UPI001FFE5B08|nr:MULTISPECIES: hypothetical protein [unclassified Crossiella]MCK2242654.1 hypothetical protein [Crossiella sp. S99.2]MCK2256531.1 hypothetical protein [Crossiella sp. S99.1]
MSTTTQITIAAVQVVLAATFVLIPYVGARHGAAAQRAAEKNVTHQGFPAGLLAQHGINFGATRTSVVLALTIALCFAALGALTLTAPDLARPLTWIAQPIMLVLGLVIMPGEVFTTRYVEAAFRKSADPATHDLNVAAFVTAARKTYPTWFPTVVVTRFATATAGSILALVLLML